MGIRISLFQKEDLIQLSHWGLHSDIRFQHYDFEGYEDEDFRRWFKQKQRLITRKLFAVWFDDELVGFMTLKNINWWLKTAYIGVVFNPDCLNRGLGTLGLQAFIEYVFKNYAFKHLYLKVVDFNRRAIRCYEKCGFVIVKSSKEPFEEQQRAFELLLQEPSLEMYKNQLMAWVHTMLISRQPDKKYKDKI